MSARLTVQCFSLVNIATLALFISFYKLSRLFFLFIFWSIIDIQYYICFDVRYNDLTNLYIVKWSQEV